MDLMSSAYKTVVNKHVLGPGSQEQQLTLQRVLLNPARHSVAYIPFLPLLPPPPVLPPGQVKPGCDFEQLSHRKAISQLLLLTDCAKVPSSENCSELNVISHHYILLQ